MNAIATDLRGWGFAAPLPRNTRDPLRARGPANPTRMMSRPTLEFALRFDAWASSLPDAPTPEQIQDHWRVSRATAYRWRSAWRAAKGLK